MGASKQKAEDAWSCGIRRHLVHIFSNPAMLSLRPAWLRSTSNPELRTEVQIYIHGEIEPGVVGSLHSLA